MKYARKGSHKKKKRKLDNSYHGFSKIPWENEFPKQFAIPQLKIESRRFTKQKIFLRRLALKHIIQKFGKVETFCVITDEI